MFPSDAILLARGKYSTLGAERRALLKRVQSSCSLIMTECQQVMRDAEKELPDNPDYLSAIHTLVHQVDEARADLVKVCEQMVSLRDEAWGGKEAA